MPASHLATVLCLAIATLCALSNADAQYPLRALSSSHARSRQNRKGAVASENKLCSQIGTEMIDIGGNAADALVATIFCIGVVDCHHSGLGGGGFALARSSNGSFEHIDFREYASSSAHEHMFDNNVKGSLVGGLASGVPGELKGLHHIHRYYGSLEWSRILQPAITLARDGFEVSHDFAVAMALSTKTDDFLTHDSVWAEDFAPNGRMLRAGEMMTRKRYARTLQTIASAGADVFYTGPIAQATIKAIQATNGTMNLKDLSKYQAISRTPVKINHKGFRIYSTGAPASGSVTLSIMNILAGYNDSDNESISLKTHRMIEAMRFGYGKRTRFGDPDFVDDMKELEEDMLSQKFAATIRNKISDSCTLNVSAYNPDGFESREDHGTSHVVAADASGMAFSLTTSVNLFFGSKVMIPETGIIMNNVMNDFSIPNISNSFGYYPTPTNYIRPYKRPLSSMGPVIIEHANKSLYAVLGSSGGSRIITTNVQNTLHLLNEDITVSQALERPRLHDQLLPNYVNFEYSYDDAIVESMKKKGHKTKRTKTIGSSGQALQLYNGIFEAAGEPRQHDSGGATV